MRDFTASTDLSEALARLRLGVHDRDAGVGVEKNAHPKSNSSSCIGGCGSAVGKFHAVAIDLCENRVQIDFYRRQQHSPAMSNECAPPCPRRGIPWAGAPPGCGGT